MATKVAEIVLTDHKERKAGNKHPMYILYGDWKVGGGAHITDMVKKEQERVAKVPATQKPIVNRDTQNKSTDILVASECVSYNKFHGAKVEGVSRGKPIKVTEESLKKFPALVKVIQASAAREGDRKPVWKVALRGTCDPSAENLGFWGRSILHRAKDCVDATEAISINSFGKRGMMEVLFNKPVLVNIGDRICGRQITESVSLNHDLTLFEGTWVNDPGCEPGQTADALFELAHVHVAAAYTQGKRISAIIEGDPSGLMGDRANVVEMDTERGLIPMIAIKKKDWTCNRCGGSGHFASRCNWQKKEKIYPPSHTIEWDKSGPINPRARQMITIPTPSMMLAGIEEREKKALETEAEIERMQVEKAEEIDDLLEAVRWSPDADSTSVEELQVRAAEAAEASILLAEQRKGTKVTRRQVLKTYGQDLMVQLVVRAAKSNEFSIVECGGKGDCGPLATLGALASVSGSTQGWNVESLREAVMLKPDEAKNEWWTGVHFSKAARVLNWPIIMLQDRPEDWRTALEIMSAPEYLGKDPILIIGGGRHNPHFQAVVRNGKDTARIIKAAFKESRIAYHADVRFVTTLKELWSERDVLMDKLPFDNEVERKKIGEIDLVNDGTKDDGTMDTTE